MARQRNSASHPLGRKAERVAAGVSWGLPASPGVKFHWRRLNGGGWPNGTAKSASWPLYCWPRFDFLTIGSPVYQGAHGDSGPAVFQTPHTIKEHKKNAPASPPGFLSRRDWASRPIPILSGPQALPAAGSRKSPRYPKPSRQSDFVIVSCLPLKPMGLSKQAYRPRGV